MPSLLDLRTVFAVTQPASPVPSSGLPRGAGRGVVEAVREIGAEASTSAQSGSPPPRRRRALSCRFRSAMAASVAGTNVAVETATRSGAADEPRAADPHIHLRRLDAEGLRDCAGKHAAAAHAGVLCARRHEQPPRLDTHLNLAAQLVQVQPVRGGHADPAPKAPAPAPSAPVAPGGSDSTHR